MDLSWGLYLPLILAAALYGALVVVAGVMASRGNEDRAERVRDSGFVVILLGGVWVIVLLLLAAFSEPDDIWDMVTITLVIVVFFALLLLVLFGISLLIGQVGRTAARRKRVTTDEL
jgi:hypothetical protein